MLNKNRYRLQEQTEFSLYGKWGKAGGDLCAHLGALWSTQITFYLLSSPFSSSLFLYTSFYPQYVFTDSFYLSSHMSFALYSTEARKEGWIPRNGISYNYLIRVQGSEFSSWGRVAFLVGTTKILI